VRIQQRGPDMEVLLILALIAYILGLLTGVSISRPQIH
jgi:hypothetical protein